MSETEHIALVILAAGESSRMQQTKQLLPWGKSTLLGKAIDTASHSTTTKVYVVLGAKADAIKEQVNSTGVHWVVNNNWKKGMGSSISCAMKHLMKAKSDYRAVLVMLCDQPFIDATYLSQMIAIFKQADKGIVATRYNDKFGVPALFDKKYFGQLTKLEGHEGAKLVIANNSNDIIGIKPNGKEIDLDTWDEYKQALKNLE
ncbi:MAG: nucleotidyltransferase family protein [Maribacter sp.]|nr:nucleotidyltransferase family protein [Maribacter sp.]NNK76532.1 nucleotidyltransferase family protein [Maribacter sp.]